MPVLLLALGGLGIVFLLSRSSSAAGGKAPTGCAPNEATLKQLDQLVIAGGPTETYAVPWPGAPVSVELAGWAYWQARQSLAASMAPGQGEGSYPVDVAKTLRQVGAEGAARWLEAMDQCNKTGKAPPPPPELVGLPAAA